MRNVSKSVWLLVLASHTLFFSCSNNKNDCFDNAGLNIWDIQLNQRIESYFDATMVNNKSVKSQNAKVYIDFSNGIVQAYHTNRDNAQIIEKITQKLTGSGTEWFGLGSGEIYPIDFSTTELYNKVTDPRSYASQLMAPIEKTLEEIVNSQGEALFVTDFEEYTTDGKEQFENFAKNYFIDWITKGNSIDFIVTDYTERTRDGRKVNKHLYFTIFSNSHDKKLYGDIEYALKDRGYTFKRFSLSQEFYTLTNKYGGEKKGGIYYDKKGKDIIFISDENQYVNGLKKRNKAFEFYFFQQDWANIIKYSKLIGEDSSTDKFTDVFRKLYLDASVEDVFQLKNLAVNVTEISDDFVFFIKTEEAKKHKPQLTKDSNGNNIFSANEKNPIALSCYYPNGEIKPEWIYQPKETHPVNEMFALNGELFRNGYKENKSNIEVGIKFHDNFDGSQISNYNGLLRVDLVISECSPNFETLNMFKWESTTVSGKTNESLAEAIRNTLDKVNPNGKVIYSYFIKTIK